VPTPTELTEIAVRRGRDKKRKNAIAALLCGAVPAVLLSFYYGSAASWELWLLGFIVGLIWGDAFEYVYHRWLLHRPRSPLGTGHHEHHARIGTAEEAEYVALISSPLNIFLLFVINGAPALLVASRMGLWEILSGVFIGWTVYLIVTEEIHWRIHMNGWLPPGLRFARAYHMCHHDIPNSRYNVFLPLFDLLFGSTGREKAKCLSNLQETRPVRTVDAPSRVGSTGRGSRSALLPESGDMPIFEFRKF
jgi:sterol desaturase/sphingolipid hydroxylase (fatty acid hydroxylase superfamily)